MVALATEELAYGDPSLATAVYYLLNNAWPFMVQRHGSDSIKEEVLPLVASGKAFIGIASTEPKGGKRRSIIQAGGQEGGEVNGY